MSESTTSRSILTSLGGCFLMAFMAAGAALSQPVTFTNVSASAGIEFQHVKDPTSEISDPSILMGAGGAWLDYDADGWLDLYATQGDGCNVLFRNSRDGTFVDVTLAAGVGACDSISHGVAPADYNNDGYTDFFLTNLGQSQLFRNNGNGTFTDVTSEAGMRNVSGASWNVNAASWGDVNLDGNLDLFLGTYVDTPDFGPPQKACQRNFLFVSDGDGTFTERGDELGVSASGVFPIEPGVFVSDGGCTLATTLTDFDGDGDPDIIVNNDFGPQAHPGNVIFRNDSPEDSEKWTFTDVTEATGGDFEMFGMGIAAGDIDNDGDLDYYYSNMGPDILSLNDPVGFFTDIAPSAGVDEKYIETYLFLGAISWGNGFADFDRDGFLDLVVAHGAAPEDVPMFRDTVKAEPTFFFRNNGDLTFTEMFEDVGLDDEQIGRGLAMADYDNDGDMDFWVGNIDGVPVLWRNDLSSEAEANNWLKVRLRGSIGNLDAIGARIVLELADGTRMMREVNGGSSFNSGHALDPFFGIGDAAKASKVEVTYSSGLVDERRNLRVNDLLTLVEPIFTTTPAEGEIVVTAGEPVPLDSVVTNWTDEPQLVQLFLDRVNPDGSVNSVALPETTLGAEASVSLSREIPTDAESFGTYVYIFTLLDEDDRLIHKAYVDVTVEE